MKLFERISRLRHLRGHGVHSPYIYSIVREAFMRRKLIKPQLSGIEECHTLSRRARLELQNLYTHCGYQSYLIEPTTEPLAEFVICTSHYPTERIEWLYEAAKRCGTTVVVELSDGERECEREHLCSEIVANHPSTTIDRRGYLIIFNNHLPKQHFKL